MSYTGGGPGAKALASSSAVGQILTAQSSSADGIVAAICAAPTALKAHGIAKGKALTSYPAFKGELEGEYSYKEVGISGRKGQAFVADAASFVLFRLGLGMVSG